ncbi:hypothetical protein Verru16b_00052 [Lacunisphaera limnophila]|uniref:Glycosyltransferase RgtA/B/C/D-like domain-containing protein n=1 Tax=Lacunisphaera limnophila TaxID=1838286 RepID=A0A1D8AQY4_9BACT|nr:hypothetical protein [Lacunisphaera limnophila]AOS43014.1 hypothetical protein Verru16b_00052 [Lacunisphaera limnophila]
MPETRPASAPFLRPGLAFAFATVAFVWWRVSENTADNDLWGHVLYGQRMLHLGGLETVETLSWSAAGQPWINHEVLAEVILGLTHRLAGGSGLWWLMIGLATLTLGGAGRAGAGRTAPQQLTALGLLALCGNSIALGYAVRPQLFTLLAFVVLLTALRRFLDGRLRWGFVPPLLLAVWVNTHGGFLAGWLIAAVILGTEFIFGFIPSLPPWLRSTPATLSRPVLLAAGAAGTLALLANPWGAHLVIWTLETLQLPRPDITEWHPTTLSAATVPFYFTIGLGLVAWILTRQPRRLGEMVAWGLLAFFALRHQRHAPLFGLATVMLLPAHVLDLLQRLAPATQGLRAALARPALRGALVLLLFVGGAWCLRSSVTAPRLHPFRMEVPRDLYPVAALDHIRTHRLNGNTITFFDWGQQVLWELPDNPVSFDGRLDTVYPTPLMDAHWRLYAGEEPGPSLPLDQARVALLPTGSGGVRLLLTRGWLMTYEDPLATVLIRPVGNVSARPVLQRAGVEAITGSVPFPDTPPVLATRFPR